MGRPDRRVGKEVERTMHALLWRDFLCPWCYLGRDRTAAMEELGVEVVALAYDLHPEVPPEGRAIRPGGRLDQVLDHIALECEQVGLPMRKPDRTPNTRQALELAEIVRGHEPHAFPAFDDACYRTHWVDGGDLGDRRTLLDLVEASGGDAATAEALLDEGVGRRAVEATMAQARDLGVTATPAWWVDDRLLIPGAQPRETVQRWVAKLATRSVS
jgi:predicted DsbA family dithiol-disulfide isomerase